LEKESSDDGLVLQRIHGVRAEHKSAADSQLRGTGIQHSTHTTSRHHNQQPTLTSGQRNLTQGHIATADGWFNRIRQVVPMCHPMTAHWRHVAKTTKLVHLSHPIPQPKRQVDQLSRFPTAHDRKSLYFTMGTPLPKTAHFHGGPKPPSPSNLCFLEPIRTYNPNGIWISSAIFAQMTIVSIYFTMGCPFAPQKIAPFHGGPGPPSNTWSPGPT